MFTAKWRATATGMLGLDSVGLRLCSSIWRSGRRTDWVVVLQPVGELQQ